MSYFTRVQFDICPFMRLEQRKNMYDSYSSILPEYDKEDIKTVFKNLIEYSFRGYQDDIFATDLLKHKSMYYTPIDLFINWSNDIIDVQYCNSSRRRYISAFKEVVSEYFDIDGLDKNRFFIKGDYCFKDSKLITFRFLQKICKFDIEEFAQKGIINEDIFTEKFDCNKRYYLVNHKDTCFYDNVFSFEEVKKFIAKHKKYCAITKDGIISVRRISGKPTIKGQIWKYAFENLIIAEDMFDDMKSIDNAVNEAISNRDKKMIDYLRDIVSEYHNYDAYNKLYPCDCGCCYPFPIR